MVSIDDFSRTYSLEGDFTDSRYTFKAFGPYGNELQISNNGFATYKNSSSFLKVNDVDLYEGIFEPNVLDSTEIEEDIVTTDGAGEDDIVDIPEGISNIPIEDNITTVSEVDPDIRDMNDNSGKRKKKRVKIGKRSTRHFSKNEIVNVPRGNSSNVLPKPIINTSPPGANRDTNTDVDKIMDEFKKLLT